jgi:urease accessory protein
MNAPLPVLAQTRWNARLSLGYARVRERTVPVLRSHQGPLRIQKGFTPEGADLWHQVIVHPPGGIASGDHLAIDIQTGPDARALITSPGAAKWYRANPDALDPEATQSISLRVGSGGSLEWLPLETIVFPGARARWHNHFELEGDAVLMAAEVVCLGRPAAALAFDHGSIRWTTSVRRDGTLVFYEQARIEGGDALLQSPAGLAGEQAFGSLMLVGPSDRLGAIIEGVRGLASADFEGQWAVTELPGLALVRWRGPGAEAGWRLLRAAWALARPILIARSACPPRIWST